MNSSKGIKRLDEYCQQTSLHGWAYVAKEKGIFKRLLWFVSMAGFISLAIYFVAKNIKEYSEVRNSIFSCFVYGLSQPRMNSFRQPL